MAFIIGNGTFTNGSVTVSGVTLTAGTLAWIASGTKLDVGQNPVEAVVEAIDAGTGTITLRDPWSLATGSRSFTGTFTTEGIRDAVQSARGFEASLQSAIATVGTPTVAATPDTVPLRDSSGRLEAAEGVGGDDVLTWKNKTSSATDTTTGALLKVGDYGFPQAVVSAEVNAANYLTSGKFIGPASGLTDFPSGASNRPIIDVTVNTITGYIEQTVTKWDTGKRWFRTGLSGSISGVVWQELYHTGNLNVTEFEYSVGNIVKTGNAVSSTLVWIELPINRFSAPSGLAVTGTYELTTVGGSLVQSGVTLAIQATRTSERNLVLEVSGATGLTVETDYQVRCSATGKLVVS